MEPAEGGAWRIASEVGGMAVGGTVREMGPGTRMVLTWMWDGDARDEPSEVTISLGHDIHGRTQLLLTHTGLADGEEVADHEQGWRDCLARLIGYVNPASGG